MYLGLTFYNRVPPKTHPGVSWVGASCLASTPQAKGCPSTPRRKGASGSAVSPTANCYLPRGDPFGNQVGMPVLQKTYLGMLQPTTHVCPKSGDSGRSIPYERARARDRARQPRAPPPAAALLWPSGAAHQHDRARQGLSAPQSINAPMMP